MPVSFSKDGPLGAFDGFDAATNYQMVPVHDKREITVTTQNECLLEVSDPSVASMANFLRLGGPPFPTPSLTTDSITLPARSRVQFSILGKLVGHTELTFTETDTHSQLLLISVKSKLPKKYALCFLKDIRRATVRPKLEAEDMMKKVSQTFLQQANIDLQFSPPSTDVTVPRDLGNPLLLGKLDVRAAILNATPDNLFSLDIRVYCSWDVEDLRPVNKDTDLGITFGSSSFIQDGGAVNEVPMIFGHEVGHALGLNHNGNIDRLMFPTTDSRSSKLAQFEIDTVNQTGTVS
jgi:hypothetical protein